MGTSIESVVIRKTSRRFVWFLILLFFICVVDRVNIGFAALSMNKELGLSAQMFGFGAGLFSVGYLLSEVPSNMILNRVGARRWICRIMVSWGIVSMAMAFARGPTSFYALRFILGVAEGGFFPGILLYLSYWFPAPYRARYNAMFLLAIPLSQTFASAISGIILNLDGTLGLAGWRWLILIEGFPAIALGIVTYFYLTDRPSAARWLTPEERDWLERTLAQEARVMNKLNVERLFSTVGNPLVLVLGLAYFGIDMVLTAIPLWLPQIVRAAGFSFAGTGLVAALPPLIGAAVMVLWSAHSDRHRERLWHLLGALALSGFGWGIAAYFIHSPSLLILSLVVANAGILAATSIFWTLPATVLTGTSAAVGIAFIGVIGNVGAAFGPMAMGYIRDTTRGFAAAFIFMGLGAVAAGLVVLLAGIRIAPPVPATPSEVA